MVTSKTLLKYSLVLCHFEVAACEISLGPQANVLKVRVRWIRARSPQAYTTEAQGHDVKDATSEEQEAVSEFANTPHSAHCNTLSCVTSFIAPRTVSRIPMISRPMPRSRVPRVSLSLSAQSTSLVLSDWTRHPAGLVTVVLATWCESRHQPIITQDICEGANILASRG